MTEKITVENICDACERDEMKPCTEPCAAWYDTLAGHPPDFGIVNGKEGGAK